MSIISKMHIPGTHLGIGPRRQSRDVGELKMFSPQRTLYSTPEYVNDGSHSRVDAEHCHMQQGQMELMVSLFCLVLAESYFRTHLLVLSGCAVKLPSGTPISAGNSVNTLSHIFLSGSITNFIVHWCWYVISKFSLISFTQKQVMPEQKVMKQKQVYGINFWEKLHQIRTLILRRW